MILPLSVHGVAAASGILSDGGGIKTIFVPVSGSQTDRAVLPTALAVARPLRAHIKFMHLRLKSSVASLLASDLSALHSVMPSDALDARQRAEGNRAVSAARYVYQFCLQHGIDQCNEPAWDTVTANCTEEAGPPLSTFISYAPHSDLTILGRRQHADDLPHGLTQELLMNSGKPLLLVPATPPANLLATVVIGWNESASSARAVSAAMPLLRLAQRVIVVHVAKERAAPGTPAEALCEQLAWHGVHAESRPAGDGAVSAEMLLPQIAEEVDASLLVVGGYGRSRLLETVLGGVTRHLIAESMIPVFMCH